MWARVKGKTENDLLKLPFRAAYMFRPGFNQPLPRHPLQTRLYQFFYPILNPSFPLLKSAFPNTSPPRAARRAMLSSRQTRLPKTHPRIRDIDTLTLYPTRQLETSFTSALANSPTRFRGFRNFCTVALFSGFLFSTEIRPRKSSR